MENISFVFRGTTVPICFSRKKMRYIRLRVMPSGKVFLSAPIKAPEAEIRAFLEEHAAWLCRKWAEKRERINYMDIPFLSESGETVLLGERRRVIVLSKGEACAGREQDFAVRVTSESSAAIARATEQRVRLFAQKLFSDLTDEMMPLFEPFGVKKPKIEVRKMRAKWGCCKCDEGIVVLNLHLVKASLDCVEYVVAHELTHFLYRGHGEDFRRFMTRIMPDWRARKRRLNEGLSAREA